MNPPAHRSLREKESFLDRAYGLYEAFSASLTVACKPGCACCCTRDVTATTLEAYTVMKRLKQTGRSSLIQGITATDSGRFQPIMTTNALAGLCASGEDPPWEDPPVSRGKCPFLDRDLCSIYGVRPFGCRCFVSKRNCSENQYADVDPFVLTVNTVFLQFIEHVDTPGLYGNFSDVLGFLDSERHLKAYEENDLLNPRVGLPGNRPVPVLMVPPEHRDRILPLLAGLQKLL
jgi:Fe-S-cluster containining protein